MKVLRLTIDYDVDQMPEIVGCDVVLEAERGPMTVHVELTAEDSVLNQAAARLRARATSVARETIRGWAA